MPSEYQQIISGASKDFGVPIDLIRSVIQVESSGNPNAVGSSGEKGLMQLMSGTARDLGVPNAFDPSQNIRGGTKYLSEQYKKTGNWRDALARYNAGKYYNGSQGQAYADKVVGVYSSLGGAPETVAAGGDVAGTDLANENEGDWLDRIFAKIENFFKNNVQKALIVLFAIIIIVLGGWKLINS